MHKMNFNRVPGKNDNQYKTNDLNFKVEHIDLTV